MTNSQLENLRTTIDIISQKENETNQLVKNNLEQMIEKLFALIVNSVNDDKYCAEKGYEISPTELYKHLSKECFASKFYNNINIKLFSESPLNPDSIVERMTVGLAKLIYTFRNELHNRFKNTFTFYNGKIYVQRTKLKELLEKETNNT